MTFLTCVCFKFWLRMAKFKILSFSASRKAARRLHGEVSESQNPPSGQAWRFNQSKNTWGDRGHSSNFNFPWFSHWMHHRMARAAARQNRAEHNERRLSRHRQHQRPNTRIHLSNFRWRQRRWIRLEPLVQLAHRTDRAKEEQTSIGASFIADDGRRVVHHRQSLLPKARHVRSRLWHLGRRELGAFLQDLDVRRDTRSDSLLARRTHLPQGDAIQVAARRRRYEEEHRQVGRSLAGRVREVLLSTDGIQQRRFRWHQRAREAQKGLELQAVQVVSGKCLSRNGSSR